MKWFVPLCAAYLLTTPIATANPPAEAILWRLWNRHMADTSDHETLTGLFQDFSRQHADDPLEPVARTLAAWHLLKLNRLDDAREWLTPLLAPTRQPPARGAHELARAWMSRLDREEVVRALDWYRTREVHFPPRLASLLEHPALPAELRPPATDRWGQQWVYRAEAMRTMPQLAGQRYTLESRSLSGTSDFKRSLAAPYAEGIPFETARVLSTGGRISTVQLIHPDQPGAPVAVSVGARHDDVYVEYASEHLIILRDSKHWKLIRTTRAP